MAIQPKSILQPSRSPGRRSRNSKETSRTSPLAALPREPPHFVEPMKARLHSELPRGDDWLFEVKLDGIRAIAIKDGSRVQLFSRLPRELTAEYPDVIEALRALPVRQFVADGEIVAL